MKMKNYYIFWFSQTVSQLGSAMTGFALGIWAFQQTNSAFAMSLINFCSYLPYIIISMFAGAFIDTHKKKNIMIISDLIAALCTTFVLIMLLLGRFEIYHIYIVNLITSLMNAFQQPASSVAVGMMVPKDKYEKVSGLNSFTGSAVAIFAPILGAGVCSVFGLQGVIFIDLGSFLFAFIFLLFAIRVPELPVIKKKGTFVFQQMMVGCKEGIQYLKQNRGILDLILSMTALNFFSRLGYENILSPMILARTDGNSHVFALVQAFIGIGGILGGLMVTLLPYPKNRIKTIYLSGAFSFLVGDLLSGIGQNAFMWCISAIATCILIPYIDAGISAIMYTKVPTNLQGRVFAVRNTLQYISIPIGILLGGFLAQYVFEPFMKETSSLATFLKRIVGSGNGSGMGVMFLCTGTLGCLTSLLMLRNRRLKNLNN